ncbi:MAG: peroxidase family protein [Bdellovibrionota bacterium]
MDDTASFNRPLHDAMNANWHGLFRSNWGKAVTKFLGKSLLASESEKGQDAWAALAAAPGIVGNPGGPVQFGSPYGLPEEFTTVYRLHPMLPDFLQVRNDLNRPYHIEKVIKTINTIQQKSPIAMKEFGDMTRVILSMGNQQLGQLVLKNYPEFIRNLEMTQHKEIGLGPIDLAALDVLRDRERGVPRYNEFRRQIGLAEVRYFSDFVNKENVEDAVACVVKSTSGCSDLNKAVKGIWDTDHDVTDLFKELVSTKDSCGGDNVAGCKAAWDAFEYQMDVVKDLADVYDHDLEKIDAIPGYLAEYSRPHGFAISETQFQIFILNASRRLFSDRFFTKDFRPGVYTDFGHSWVVNNGPNKGDGGMSPLKALLIRNFPELKATLAGVENVFDIWNRKRSDYYSLKWTPRDARDDGFNTKKLSELHEKAND